tara:strand:- start:36834 stop:38075 length:1242 start_codon:yes stop_codon:yes gene_type:complete
MRERWAKLLALASLPVVMLLALGFGWQQLQRGEQLSSATDPALWQTLYPLHVASYFQGGFLQGNGADTSPQHDRLAENPFRARAWAGMAFELEYNAARAHYYAQADQRNSRRTLEREQPAGCIHCHAAEAPALVAELGWDNLNAMSYQDIAARVHHGSSCADCHQPGTMALTITRPALRNALQSQGIDPDAAPPEKMRDYVCAQCHVEYYFRGDGNELVFPWANGLEPDSIERFYADLGFSDWTHPGTGAGLIKVQHPNYELHSQGPHAAVGVSCADCHMPRVQFQGSEITDHWIRSPLQQVQQACMGCHRGDAARMTQRTQRIQQNTDTLLAQTESALSTLMDALSTAQTDNPDHPALAAAQRAHRQAQFRWDFVDADASRGVHAPEAAARLLEQARQIATDGAAALAQGLE